MMLIIHIASEYCLDILAFSNKVLFANSTLGHSHFILFFSSIQHSQSNYVLQPHLQDKKVKLSDAKPHSLHFLFFSGLCKVFFLLSAFSGFSWTIALAGADKTISTNFGEEKEEIPVGEKSASSTVNSRELTKAGVLANTKISELIHPYLYQKVFRH